ncbi:MAG: beta-ketoacyl-[acyl-carrier-protein] synthase family protein [Elusimicrobiaceae bacterium]|nr:beta-ketoacyl-[acyl-carrier-protein] synthase family protein [Elusimicrobiaceae bacterium]
MSLKQVSIAGMGCVCACGNTAAETFEGALSGNALFELPADRITSTYTTKYPVFLVNPTTYQNKPADQTFSQFFFIRAAQEAFAQAGILPSQLTPSRVGVIVGSSVHSSFHCFQIYKQWRQNSLTSQDIAGLKNYLATPLAQWVSNYFGFTGPFQTIATACASGTDAIGLAKNWIETDLCDVVLCGGTDELTESPYDGFIRLLVSTPQRCRPFCKTRSGINIGEGAAALLLVNEQTAQKFQLPCQGYVLGYGNCCDGFHPTAPDPKGTGLQKALSFALQDAGKNANDIAFINAHGTASQANDSAEAIAFRAVLPQVPVWGSKSVTGHTLGAAGAIEAVLTLQALNKRILPATVGFSTPDEQLQLVPTQKQTTISKRFAVSDSLAFGGCNAAIVLGACDAA